MIELLILSSCSTLGTAFVIWVRRDMQRIAASTPLPFVMDTPTHKEA